MGLMEKIEQEQRCRETNFRPGDTVRVHVRITEGDKTRVQVFEGVVIALRGGGNRASFTVRKLSYGIGVERVFPLHSPVIEKIEVVSSGKVRRARLYYLRGRRGKAARLKDRDVARGGRRAAAKQAARKAAQNGSEAATTQAPA